MAKRSMQILSLLALISTNVYAQSSYGCSSTTSSAVLAGCTEPATTLHLSDPPYENYFYSDCHSDNQVVVTSPQPDSNLTIIGPRLLVAWPAGNSGTVAFFAPQNGINGTLAIHLVNSTAGKPLNGVYYPANDSSLTGNPIVGVSTLIRFNSSAVLTVPIMGSIRTIRDFTEGPSILVPEIQDAITVSRLNSGGAQLSRLWLDNITTTQMSFVPQGGNGAVTVDNKTLSFTAGTYRFTATFDYPQLKQLSQSEVLKRSSQNLITQQPDNTKSLSFLSYTNKLVAGAWRFLTYFGRDSMISLLLMQPILSEGQGGAIEAVIGAVLDRINSTDADGSVCHEETIGDYATYLNEQNNITGKAALQPECDYKMIDSDYYLPVAMENYFIKTATGRRRRAAFFKQRANFNEAVNGTLYSTQALYTAQKIMRLAGPFASTGGQKKSNLIHLKEGQIVGEWRDSTYGIGGGRIPYDVNTALVPAALRSISALSAAGFFPQHPRWAKLAATYAKIWEDNTLRFFEVNVPEAEAKELVTNYTKNSGYGIPSHVGSITSDITFHGLALDGNNNQEIVKVMNTDDCFRLFFLNTTNQAQLTAFVNQTANHVRLPFPVGLSTPVGLVVANPAYGGAPVYAANWTNNAYHGTVVWSWQLAMMATGLQRQLGRCNTTEAPDFCGDKAVYNNVRAAYNHLWNIIDANRAVLTQEVWSWVYRNNKFVLTPLGALPPPAGQSPTESDIVQLWSLTFLSVTRDESLKS